MSNTSLNINKNCDILFFSLPLVLSQPENETVNKILIGEYSINITYFDFDVLFDNDKYALATVKEIKEYWHYVGQLLEDYLIENDFLFRTYKGNGDLDDPDEYNTQYNQLYDFANNLKNNIYD
jgi:hypothetical protein